ncbi:MAG: PIN domain-containing protein [Candidatus Hydrogenedentes bacterium]|nr:PIN domain-containing protein [Candidatus Hydrogenedentota bacterium]
MLASGERVFIHAVNMVEVRYHYQRRGEQALEAAICSIAAAAIEVERVMDDRFLTTAAYLKAVYPPIALGDVFAVALAMRLQATLVTTDRGELEKIAAAGLCPIEFLR